ncbi:MAG: molybdopterin molybdotransferase MoeA [Archangium sp.]|nr:molybdopterin molybdotransferase MoeA [Archangium sp.]
MLSVDEAQTRILKSASPLDREASEISDALERALVSAISAQRTLPPWDNSAMDGYAVIASDVVDAPVKLKIAQTIFAGDRPTIALERGTCARIMTGAPLPPGADAVVMQEKARPESEGRVSIDEAARAGANVRKRGEDIVVGAPLFEAGRVISLSDAGALWSQGLTTVEVFRRPRVAIASSGDELADLGSADVEKIIDSNSPVIAEGVKRAGGVATRLGRARDTLDSHVALFERGLAQHDVLITIAGASVGEKDFTREALLELGVEIDFWKVAMKPGKPLAFGRRGKTLVFGLPGNPVSAMVTFELFVRPALRALQGLSALPPHRTAHLGAPIHKAAGLRHFVRATTAVRDGVLWASPLASQSSGGLASASGATCLIDVAEAETHIEAGSEIRVFPLSW